jgi:Cupin-like domain
VTAAEATRVDALPVRGGAVNRPMLGAVPLLIAGVASKWACSDSWDRASLTRRLGELDVAPFVTGDGPRNTVLKQVNATKSMKFGEALAHLFGVERVLDGSLYLRIGAGSPGFDDLAQDFEVPDVGADYEPAATGVWFSQTGNVTPAHHDWWHSFLIQVRGSKRYTLVHPLDAVSAQRNWQAGERFDLSAAPELSSSATPDWDGEVRYEGILSAGEILYIPPFWLHEVETLTEGNISIPMRFATSQSVASDLHQLSQDGVLRSVTNTPTQDVATIIEVLGRNHREFLAREEEFIRALVGTRELDVDAGRLLADVRHGDGAER